MDGTDYRHFTKGYIKSGFIRVAEAYLWSHEFGYAGHFSCNEAEIMAKAA